MIDQMIYSLITNPAGPLAGDIYENVPQLWRLYPRGALGTTDIPSAPTFPYIMFGENAATQVQEVRFTRNTFLNTIEFYVYDSAGSFLRIKRIHEVLHGLLTGMNDTYDSVDSSHCTDVLFLGYSQDGYDPVNKQNSKSASYRFVVSK